MRNIIKQRIWFHAALLGVVWVTANPLGAAPVADFRVDSKSVDRSLSWNLGPTGMRGCLNVLPGAAERFPGEGRLAFLNGAITPTSRQILVIDVGVNTPADGLIQVDDVILGVGGKLFESDARQSFARAITEAEKEANKGVLALTVWRQGKTRDLKLQLKVMGTYAATAPYDCPKSKQILAEACKVLAQEPMTPGPNSFACVNGLALLATGDAQYLAKVREYARLIAPKDLRLEGCSAWMFGYNNLFLCEYYLLTGDKEVLHGIREHTMALALGQGIFGTFGHGGAVRTADGKPGSIPWYGPINAAGLIANMSIVMGKKCGVKDPEVDAAIQRASKFFAYYVNKGSIPYGEHEPEMIHDNNGKSAMTALLFALQGDHLAETRYFARMSTAGYLNREVGHTGQGFSYLWTALGANTGGPAAAAAFFREASWHLDLVRRSDGDFTYDGGEQCGPGQKGGVDNTYFGKASYAGISPAATYVLTYALPLRILHITGREFKPDSWLSATEVAEAVASGRFHWDRARKTATQLVAALNDWSPVVRCWAAEELASRPEAKALVASLITMAEGSSANVRQGACQALGQIKDASALPVLGRCLTDSDPWVRSKAAKALNHFGAEAGPQLTAMLAAMAANAKPALPVNAVDPLQFANGFLAEALFAGQLCEAASKAPKDLLYPAVVAGLELPSGMWRAKVGALLRERLTLEDVEALAPGLFALVGEQAPADRMFSVIPPCDGMIALAKHHVSEGIGLALGNVNSGGWIRDAALNVLATYGDAARCTLPGLRALLVQWDHKTDEYARLVACIESIENATTSPVMVSGMPVAPSQVVVAGAARTFTLGGVKPGQVCEVLTQPVHGTLTGKPPELTYTPKMGYRGTDRFTFKVRAGLRESQPATVSFIVGAPGTGLRGEYFNNGKLKLTRNDPTVNFDWGNGAPDPSLEPGNLAVRWTGQLLAPETTTYIFSMLSADGIRLWVNGVRVINDFKEHPLRWTDGTPLSLTEGKLYDIRIECFKTSSGPAVAKLKWSGPSFAGPNGVAIDKEWLYPTTGAPPVVLAQSVTTSTDTPKLIVLSTGETVSEALSYAIVTPPKHGALSGAAPTLTYTPASGHTGMDCFSYCVTRGKAAPVPATIGIIIKPKSQAGAASLADPAESNPAHVVIGPNKRVDGPGPAADAAGVVMKGGTLACGLKEGATIVLAKGTTSTIDLPAALGKVEFKGKMTGKGSLVLAGSVPWFGFESSASDSTGSIKVALTKQATLRLGGGKPLGLGTVIFAGPDGSSVVSLIGSNNQVVVPNEIRLDSDLIYTQSGGTPPLSLHGNIHGAGRLIKPFAVDDRGTRLQLRGLNNTYSGGTELRSGCLDVLGDGSLGSGPVTLGGKASPEHAVAFVNQSPMRVANNYILAGISEPSHANPSAPAEFLVDQDLEISGDISGTGGLLKTGPKTLTLSGVNTFTGPTRIQAGALAVSSAASLGYGSLDLADAARLRLDYRGSRRVAAVSIGGKALAPGTYGSTDSPATTKDDKHFSGAGLLIVGPR